MSAYPITDTSLQRLQQLISLATSITMEMRQSGPACVRVDACLILLHLADAMDVARDAEEVLEDLGGEP